MTYNQQPRYGGSSTTSYRQRPPEDASQPYSPTQHYNAAGDLNFDFGESLQHEPTQQVPNDRYGPQSGDLIQYRGMGPYGPEGREYHAGRFDNGYTGRSDGRGQNMFRAQDHMRVRNGEMRRPQGPPRAIESERKAYVDPRARGPTPPNHGPLPIHSAAQPSQKQYESQYQQPSQTMQSHGFPVEPVFDNEPEGFTGSKYIRTKTHHEPQTYLAFSPSTSYLNNQGGNSANTNERITIGSQHPDYGKPYPRGISPGNSGHTHGYLNSDTAQTQLIHERSHTSSNESQSTQFHNNPRPNKSSVTTSPETISWDNPFPTFPINKGKSAARNQSSLDKTFAEMRLADDRRGGRRPQTASSKISQSSRMGDRKPQVKDTLEHPDSNFQRPLDPGLKFFDHQAGPYSLDHQPTGRSQHPGDLNGSESMHEVRPPISQTRQSEDTKTRPSFPFDNSEPQRSKTMPLSISEAVQATSHQRAYVDQPVWQEPGANGKYHRFENIEHFPSQPNDASQSIRTSRPASKSGVSGTGTAQGKEGSNDREFVSRPPHSAQNSLGDFYDSYYSISQHDKEIYAQGQKKQSRFSVEDMPNFDAFPQTNTGYSQGMTIDDHLPPVQTVPEPWRSSPHHQNGNSGSVRSNGHIAGQLYRSKSQPNLDDQYSRSHLPDNNFVFDLPPAVPAMPPVSPLKDESGPRNFQYPSTRGHLMDQEAKPHNQHEGISQLDNSNDGVKAYHPEQQSFQPSERYQSPPPQNEYPHDGQRIRPGIRPNPSNAVGPISPIKKSSTHPDALPPHPVPIRPGLMQGSSSELSAKPPPIRQYNNGPLNFQRPSSAEQAGAPPPSNAKRDSVPVTHEELERLRQAVKSSPSDQKAQLVLAKKLVEASSVLVDNNIRTDQKSKNKAREKYILDAHKIVKKLVHSNSVDATFYLADCYSRGLLGLEVDTKEAFSLYQTAAKAGHAQSAYRVAVCCEMGQDEGGGTRRDPQKAMQWYKRAATLGDTPAMYKIGIIKLKGLLGQPKEPQEALIWLRRAADRADEENPHALHELALLHEGTGTNQTVAKDEAYSRRLFTQAANLGYKFSQFRLGCAYEYGLMGSPIDPRQSIAWYSKAAVQEEHQSELALSGWYLTGSEGVLQQSDTEAYLWARKAAQSGLAKAEYAMGYFTEVGIGAPTNIEDAKRWYWRAASQNFPKAKDRLEELRKGGAKMQKSRVSRSTIRKQSEGECALM